MVNEEKVKPKTATSAFGECQCPDCVAKRKRMQSYQPLPEQTTTIAAEPTRSIIRNPDNFYPELSPDYEFLLSGRKYK